MMHTKCEAVSQITFDEDLNVPDIKPDVGRMIQKKGEIHIDDVQISEGHAFLTGALMVYLLYVSDSEERRIQSLLGTLPIGETMHLEGLENGDKVRVKWDIEDLSVQLINSRKLNIKALVTFTASVEEMQETNLPAGVDAEGISQKKRTSLSWGSRCIKRTPCGSRRISPWPPTSPISMNFYGTQWKSVVWISGQKMIR